MQDKNGKHIENGSLYKYKDVGSSFRYFIPIETTRPASFGLLTPRERISQTYVYGTEYSSKEDATKQENGERTQFYGLGECARLELAS